MTLIIGLAGCSSVCLVNETDQAKNVKVLSRYDGRSDRKWGIENEHKLEQCIKKTHYHYSQGNYLADIIGVFNVAAINARPSCLLKKAKNEVANSPDWVAVESSHYHAEAGLVYNINTYACPPNIQFDFPKK